MTSRSAENLHTPRAGAYAPAPPLGGAAPRPSMPAPAVASSLEGETPTEPGNVASAALPSEQATGAYPNGSQRIDISDDAATTAFMTIKDKIFEVKMRG